VAANAPWKMAKAICWEMPKFVDAIFNHFSKLKCYYYFHLVQNLIEYLFFSLALVQNWSNAKWKPNWRPFLRRQSSKWFKQISEFPRAQIAIRRTSFWSISEFFWLIILEFMNDQNPEKMLNWRKGGRGPKLNNKWNGNVFWGSKANQPSLGPRGPNLHCYGNQNLNEW